MSGNKTQQGLWTRDFTIITLGSVVSMVGAALSGFAISIMVLDYTGSTFLYVLFNVCYQLPMLICPLLAGPYLDRMSRKKVIYRLDFLSAAIFLLVFFLLRTGWFSYPVMLVGCMLIGAINSVYMVAYDSFYPNLITPGNYAKAYSVSSMLWPLAAMSSPIAAFIYESIGTVVPLFAFNAACFFTAACFERNIKYEEIHMKDAPPADGMGALRRFRRDFREGLEYIVSEKGLLAITLYFMVSGFVGGGGNLYLPFFCSHAEQFAFWPVAAVTLYSIVSNFSVAGRLGGAALHYRIHIPREKKFTIAIIVYITISVIEMVLLYTPVPIMALLFFASGALAVTSYNIRIAATQSYIPDVKRARFNGTFQMLSSLGGICGSLAAGSLAEIMPERHVIILLHAIGLVAVYVFMYRGRKHVANIYNRDL